MTAGEADDLAPDLPGPALLVTEGPLVTMHPGPLTLLCDTPRELLTLTLGLASDMVTTGEADGLAPDLAGAALLVTDIPTLVTTGPRVL